MLAADMKQPNGGAATSASIYSSAAAELSQHQSVLGFAIMGRTNMVKRIRVEPISSHLEKYRKARKFNPVSVANGFAYVSGMPPFDPDTGELTRVPFETQAVRVMEQLKLALETAGTSLKNAVKCNVYCVRGPDDGENRFAIFNEVYDRYFPDEQPARIFMYIESWPGPFDVEIDCVAAMPA
jgi:2-iminobutanoate/2-iminopropanoate deaminase